MGTAPKPEDAFGFPDSSFDGTGRLAKRTMVRRNEEIKPATFGASRLLRYAPYGGSFLDSTFPQNGFSVTSILGSPLDPRSSFDLTHCWNRAVLWTRLSAPTIMTIRNAVHNDCSASLVKIENMPASALRALWRELIGGSAATRLRRELLVPILAYKLQERAYGGLKPATRTHLRRIAASLATDKSALLTRVSRFKPGTRLIREWRGDTHEVTIRSSGFCCCETTRSYATCE